MTILSFVSEISPSQNEIDTVSTSGISIRDTIQSKIDFVSSSFLTGSYKRNTKITPIDDLDIFFTVNAGNTYVEWSGTDQKKCKLYISNGQYDNHLLKNYSVYDNARYCISPNKIMNHIKTKIQETYTSTPDIVRNGECVTVYLSSYDLTIDCVPYVGITDAIYSLIPQGDNSLYWKKSNPKIDEDKINELNGTTFYNGKLKGIIKIMKYWNDNKNSSVSFKSYILECLVYHALNANPQYLLSYSELLKVVIKSIYINVGNHCNILDLPGYDFMHYSLDYTQKQNIKNLLQKLWDELHKGDDAFISYLES